MMSISIIARTEIKQTLAFLGLQAAKKQAPPKKKAPPPPKDVEEESSEDEEEEEEVRNRSENEAF